MSRKQADILWKAFQYAIQDRNSLIDAYASMPNDKAVRDAQRDIRDFEAMKTALFGTTKSKGEAMFDRAKSVTIGELRRMIERGEIMPEEGEL